MSKAKTKDPGRTPLEWTILAISGTAILLVVTALAFGSLRTASGPPDLRTTIGSPVKVSGGLAFEIRVRNVGGETAENVEIEVSAGEETRTLTLTAVARRDEARGTVVFPQETTAAPKATVQSYSVGGR